ncbi:MAG: HAMP domain-containing sensor histidine kinase [Pseudomonadota bacterium]
MNVLNGTGKTKDQLVGELKALEDRCNRAEEELKAARKNFHNIVVKSPDGIVVVDTDRVVRFTNPATKTFFGHQAEESLGQLCDDSVLACEVAEVGIVSRSGKTGVGDIRIVETEWEGQNAYLISIRDITERNKTEKALWESERMASEFISVASHELRTPLTSIKNAVDIILERRAGEITGIQEQFLCMAERNVNRLTRLINNLLDISKIEAGKIDLNYTETEIKNSIENVLRAIRPLAEKKSMTLEMMVGPDVPTIYVDVSGIETALLNIIENAVKFTPQKGTIRVEAYLAEEMLANATDDAASFVEISVADTGIGIPEGLTEHIFEKFYQVESSLSKERHSGAGLGLTISKDIIAAHGGEIHCKSRESKGSTFTVTLPIVDKEKLFYTTLKDELSKARKDRSKLSVLLIEIKDFQYVTEVYEKKEWENVLQTVKERIIKG